MALEPLQSSGDSTADLNVCAVLEHLAECAPFNMERTKGRWSKWLTRAATTANWIGLSLLPFFAVFAALRYELGPVAGILNFLLLFMGLVALPLAGLTSLLCTMVSDSLHLLEMHKRRGHHWAQASCTTSGM